MTFTIVGNQEDERGNPIPYHRATQRGRFNKGQRRYYAWKDHVRASFAQSWDRSIPLTLDGKIPGTPVGKVTAEICFGSETHADPDNVVKGILDALFQNDKHVDVETKHSCRHDEPRVLVNVTLQ